MTTLKLGPRPILVVAGDDLEANGARPASAVAIVDSHGVFALQPHSLEEKPINHRPQQPRTTSARNNSIKSRPSLACDFAQGIVGSNEGERRRRMPMMNRLE
ncbi:hypothetical protein NL676_023523 [Syzygium grande]|nr:hypothetical protein NL676_023523 [Syzygium grande]